MTSTSKAVAIVSGGLDSVVSLACALDAHQVRVVLFFDYGQRAGESERASVMAVTDFYGLPFREVDITWLEKLAPEGMQRHASETGESLETLDQVWIPNRNGVFLGVAAAYAEAYGCDYVICGFNREEAMEFPDNSADFVERTNSALAMSTRNHVTVRSYTLDMDKRDIILRGAEVGAPLSVIWSCYRSGPVMCGRCGSCVRLKAALAATPAASRPVLEFEAGHWLRWKRLEGEVAYSGRELRPGWVAAQTGLQGDAAVAFAGPCNVATEDLVDLDDRRAGETIVAARMAHVIVEHPACSIRAGVLRQRLLVCILCEALAARGVKVRRSGDDVYVADRKLTVSIAAPASQQCLMHLGINVDPAGAPVAAIGLAELGVDAEDLVESVLAQYAAELDSAAHAQNKVCELGDNE